MQLTELLERRVTRISEVVEWFADRPFAERREAVFSLDRAGQRRLYAVAAQAEAISLPDLVPAARAVREEVRHHGRNTLPVPKAFRTFEKRFCRPDDGTARLFGYNEGASVRWFGPGYFVAYPVRDNPVWAARGDVVVDYFQVPDRAVVGSWPRVVPNEQGLQRLVFAGTRDFLRRVTDGVSIGAAYKGERSLDHYFVLVRDDR
jgi:hypothetical protein